MDTNAHFNLPKDQNGRGNCYLKNGKREGGIRIAAERVTSLKLFKVKLSRQHHAMPCLLRFQVSGTKFCYEETSDNCFRLEHVLAPGSDISGGGLQKSIVDCQNKCLETQDCDWFSYNYKLTGDNCFLKSEFPGEEEKETGAYGPRICTGKRKI